MYMFLLISILDNHIVRPCVYAVLFYYYYVLWCLDKRSHKHTRLPPAGVKFIYANTHNQQPHVYKGIHYIHMHMCYIYLFQVVVSRFVDVRIACAHINRLCRRRFAVSHSESVVASSFADRTGAQRRHIFHKTHGFTMANAQQPIKYTKVRTVASVTLPQPHSIYLIIAICLLKPCSNLCKLLESSAQRPATTRPS